MHQRSSFSPIIQSTPDKKARKPYTITKQRQSWTDEEHSKFVAALKLYDRDWKKIEAYVGTKTVIQIRSHAQKYFLKIQKNKTGERIPPPRPKRKAGGNFSNSFAPSKMAIKFSTYNPEPFTPFSNFTNWSNTHYMNTKYTPNTVPSTQQSQLQAQMVMQHNLSNQYQVSRMQPVEAPNYPKIYRYLGSLFNPNENQQQEQLDNMNAIDKETTQILMHNLAINLVNRNFTDTHKTLIEQKEFIQNTYPSPSNEVKQETDINTQLSQTNHPATQTKELPKLKFSDPCFLLKNETQDQ